MQDGIVKGFSKMLRNLDSGTTPSGHDRSAGEIQFPPGLRTALKASPVYDRSLSTSIGSATRNVLEDFFFVVFFAATVDSNLVMGMV